MAVKSHTDIIKELKSGSVAPVYFFYGEESYFINSLVDVAEEHILEPGQEAFNKTVFYGKDSDVASILDQVRRFPMMAERQLVILKEAQALKDFGSLKAVFEKPIPTTVLVVAYQQAKMDKRLAIFKAINKHAVVFEAKKLYENQVPAWLNAYLKDKKLKLSPRAITLLIEYLGTDLEKLANAIQKLAIASEGTEVDDHLVEDTIGVSRAYNVFELQEALGQRHYSKMMNIAGIMEKDLKNNPLQLVIPSLFNYISKLYMIKPLGNNMADVKKVLRIRSEFIMKKYIAASKKYTLQEFERMIHTLRDFDLKSKGVAIRDISPEAIFREMMLRLVHVA